MEFACLPDLKNTAMKKKIQGYAEKYEVTDDGRVLSRGSELSIVSGMYVNLSGPEEGVRKVKVAYLVARAFIPNLEGRPYVIHRDGNRRNNRVENLEWSEVKEAHGGGRRMVKEPVVVRRRDGSYVGGFECAADAARALGLRLADVRKVARGAAGSVHGYVIRYWE